MPFIEFAYNRVIHSTTDYSPFKIVYGFNTLTPLELVSLPVHEKLHENVWQHFERKNREYASEAYKGIKKMFFQLGDSVWLL